MAHIYEVAQKAIEHGEHIDYKWIMDNFGVKKSAAQQKIHRLKSSSMYQTVSYKVKNKNLIRVDGINGYDIKKCEKLHDQIIECRKRNMTLSEISNHLGVLYSALKEYTAKTGMLQGTRADKRRKTPPVPTQIDNGSQCHSKLLNSIFR